MKTKILKVRDDGTLKDNMWTPEEYYAKFDTEKEYQLQRGAPLCYRINGMFTKASWLEHHIVGWYDKMQYFQGMYIPEWVIIR